MNRLARWTAAFVALGSTVIVHPVLAQRPAVFDTAEIGIVAQDRKSTRLNSSHSQQSRMPSSA